MAQRLGRGSAAAASAAAPRTTDPIRDMIKKTRIPLVSSEEQSRLLTEWRSNEQPRGTAYFVKSNRPNEIKLVYAADTHSNDIIYITINPKSHKPKAEVHSRLSLRGTHKKTYSNLNVLLKDFEARLGINLTPATLPENTTNKRPRLDSEQQRTQEAARRRELLDAAAPAAALPRRAAAPRPFPATMNTAANARMQEGPHFAGIGDPRTAQHYLLPDKYPPLSPDNVGKKLKGCAPGTYFISGSVSTPGTQKFSFVSDSRFGDDLKIKHFNDIKIDSNGKVSAIMDNGDTRTFDSIKQFTDHLSNMTGLTFRPLADGTTSEGNYAMPD